MSVFAQRFIPGRTIFVTRSSYYSTSSSLNNLSSFFKKVLFGSEKENKESLQTSKHKSLTKRPPYKKRLPRASNEEITQTIKTIGTSLFPNEHDWATTSITDINVKSKVLYQCERELRRTIPDRVLGSIKTLGDLETFLHLPPRKPPGLLFPDIRGKKLPPNLSIEFPNNKEIALKEGIAPYRKPFQNYDNPKHWTFPNKKKNFKKFHEKRYK